jgi:hypothetical protein
LSSRSIAALRHPEVKGSPGNGVGASSVTGDGGVPVLLGLGPDSPDFRAEST